jgi:meiotic recombination protein SPO11
MIDLKVQQNRIQLIIFNFFDLVKGCFSEQELPDVTCSIDIQKIGTKCSSIITFIFLAQYSQVLLEVYKNIEQMKVRTKRDVYYSATDLFKTQSTLDSIVSELTNAMKVPRDALNLIATGKGLVFGSSISINGIAANLAQLIPSRQEIRTIQCHARFVLVVEKDAVMTTIIQYYKQMARTLSEFVIVTGKGYPCLKTKQFLHLIQESFPTIPLYCLVDHDPFGIHICLTYAAKSPVT